MLTMTPPPCRSITREPSWHDIQTVLRLFSIILSNNVSSPASAGPKVGASSALTRICNPPSSFAARSAVADTSARVAASCTRTTALVPAAVTSFATSLSCLSVPGSCEASTILAPASASATAAARPTACSAPITNALLPSSEKSFDALVVAILVRILRRHSGRRDSAGESAAVDRDQFSIDVVGRVGGEEHRKRSKLSVFADAADRNKFSALEKLQHLFVVREDAGYDAIGLDVELRVGQRHRSRQLDRAALRARVHEVVLTAAQSVAGRDVDNLAALLLDHLGGDRAASVELTAEIGVDAAPPIFVGDF